VSEGRDVMKQLDGKVALVTGAGSGIGRATAMLLAAEGAAVVATDINADAVGTTVDEIRASGGRAVAFTGDVASPDDVRASVELAVATFGGLHLAVNNAGIVGPLGRPEDIDIDAYRRVIDVNLNSVFYGLKFEIPAIRASGGGAIVNTSSVAGLAGLDNALGYTTTKHGVVGMTKSAALAYASEGIRINTVNPGYVDTPLLGYLDDAAMAELATQHPMGRLATADEVAQVILFLLSGRSGFVTGAQYVVDGGYIAQ